MKVLFTIVALACSGAAACAQNITLHVSGLRTAKGDICVSVFRDSESFKANKPSGRVRVSKAATKGGSLSIPLTLAAGTYGIAVLDDENGNGKMDNSMLGLPKEGFGFSDFYLSGMSRPAFSDFRFEVGAAPLRLSCRLRYL